MFKRPQLVRNEFLKNGDINNVNDYFKKLEVLSNTNGGKYTDILNYDMNYYLNLHKMNTLHGGKHNVKQNVRQTVRQSGGQGPGRIMRPPIEINMCDKLKSKPNKTCDQQRLQLLKISNQLEHVNISDVDIWKDLIRQFMDYFACCSDAYIYPIHKYLEKGNNEYDGRLESKFVSKILKTILKNAEMTDRAYDLLLMYMTSQRTLQKDPYFERAVKIFEKVASRHKNHRNLFGGGSNSSDIIDESGSTIDDYIDKIIKELYMSGINRVSDLKLQLMSGGNYDDEVRDDISIFLGSIQYLSNQDLDYIKVQSGGHYKRMGDVIRLITKDSDLLAYSSFISTCSIKMGYKNKFLKCLASRHQC